MNRQACQVSADGGGLANDQLTASRVKSPPTSLALEMLCLLMIDQDLQIIEVALTIVTPGSRNDLLDVWMLSLWLAHRVFGRGDKYCRVDRSLTEYGENGYQ